MGTVNCPRKADKDFCLSSYIAFRYIWKDDIDFYKKASGIPTIRQYQRQSVFP